MWHACKILSLAKIINVVINSLWHQFPPSDPEQDAAARSVSGRLVPQPPRLRAPPDLPGRCAAEEVPEHSEGSGDGRALHRVHCQ